MYYISRSRDFLCYDAVVYLCRFCAAVQMLACMRESWKGVCSFFQTKGSSGRPLMTRRP